MRRPMQHSQIRTIGRIAENLPRSSHLCRGSTSHDLRRIPGNQPRGILDVGCRNNEQKCCWLLDAAGAAEPPIEQVTNSSLKRNDIPGMKSAEIAPRGVECALLLQIQQWIQLCGRLCRFRVV